MSSKWTSEALTANLFPSAEASAFGRRVRRARGGRIPIVLVTGFLGAGKTTLIQRILASPEGASSAVIVNEYGDIGLDHTLLRTSSENIVLLGNGCLCCSTRSDLEETLAELLAQAATGAVPSFRRVIVETSGLADPGPILQTFAADRGIGREFHLETVVTVADAPSIESNLARMPEAERQVLMADRIVLGKTDLADGETVERLRQLLAGCNPSAEILAGTADDIDLGRLLEPPACARAEASGHARHTRSVECFTMCPREPVAWQAFASFMTVLTDLRGGDLLRVKGLLETRDQKGPLVIHAVQHIMHPPVELLDWPDEDRTSRLVFITRNLGRESVESLFRSICEICDYGAKTGSESAKAGPKS